MTFTVLIKFNKDYIKKNKANTDKVYNFYNSNHPIAKRSGGSVVAMKNSDYWLDYYKVTSREISKLLKYMEEIDDEEFKKNMYLTIRV